MKTREQIEHALDELLARVNNEEPDEFNDRDEEQEWYGIHSQIDILNWVLAGECE